MVWQAAVAYHDRRALTLAALVLLGCARPAVPGGGAPPAPQPEGFLKLEASRLVGTDAQGQVRWELRAASVVVDRNQQVTALEPSGFLVGEGARVHVQARRAIYQRGSNAVRLVGEVRVAASPRRWLAASEVTYEVLQSRLVATGGVRLHVDGWAATARRLEGEPALRRARLSGDVQVTAETDR